MKNELIEDDLYIWYNRTKLPKGFPLAGKYLLNNSFDIKNPRKISEQKWTLYNSYRMGFPPSDDKFKFPNNIYLVILDKQKDILFDYFDYEYNVKLVSEKFLQFIQKNGLTKGYEEANLFIIDTKENLLSNRKYYALRFGLFDDNFFDFNKQNKISGKYEFGNQYIVYPNLSLKENKSNKYVYCLEEYSYRKAIIFKGFILNDILKTFYCPEIYKLKDFPFICANQYDWDLLPYDNDYKVR
jgi:hypothetical protein